MLIDELSLVYMGGSVIDFVDDLMGQSFQIKNPNAVASCGCGTSFSSSDGPAPVLRRRTPLASRMKIVTWNINGVRARLGNFTHWLRESAPDIVCLQEIKSLDDQFPRAEVEALGYNVETHGQKGFNGVALLSKLPFDEVSRGLPGDDGDEQARFIEGVFSTPTRARCASPRSICRTATRSTTTRSSPTSSPGWRGWNAGPQRGSQLEEPLVLAGDYNVIPEPTDARFPENWVTDALFQPRDAAGVPPAGQSRLHRCHARGQRRSGAVYTFWDYQAGAWQKNNGIRIDHLMLSPEAADRLAARHRSKSMSAPGRSRPTTCRRRSSCGSDAG